MPQAEKKQLLSDFAPRVGDAQEPHLLVQRTDRSSIFIQHIVMYLTSSVFLLSAGRWTCFAVRRIVALSLPAFLHVGLSSVKALGQVASLVISVLGSLPLFLLRMSLGNSTVQEYSQTSHSG